MPPRRQNGASGASAASKRARLTPVPAPGGEGLIDWQGYPHIVEAIFQHTSWRTRLAFRLTNRYFHSLLDLTRVTVQSVPNGAACEIEVVAPGGFKVASIPCTARRNLSELWTCAAGERASTRSFRTFLVDIAVVGQCPHRGRGIVAKLVENLTTTDGHWGQDMGLPARPDEVQDPEEEDQGGRRFRGYPPRTRAPAIHLIPDAHGVMPVSMPSVLNWAHVLVDNYRTTPGTMRMEWHTDVVVVPLFGHESSPPIPTAVENATVVYDLSRWEGGGVRERTPAEDGGGDDMFDPDAPCACANPRFCALVTHACRALGEGRVYVDGRERLASLDDSGWLDPLYGGICGMAMRPHDELGRDSATVFWSYFTAAVHARISRTAHSIFEVRRMMGAIHWIEEGRSWGEMARRSEFLE